MGTCKELQVIIPFTNISPYECECNPGWSWPNVTLPLSSALPLPPHLFLSCTIPTCVSTPEFTCYKPKLPNAANTTLLDPCSYNDCGSEGTCVREEDLRFRCQCNPGATNVKSKPYMPCIKNCAIDDKGCPVSSSTAPPGSVSLKNRLRLSLLLASLAALHAVTV
ncbi:neurogenic locus protein delta-like [Triticum dicoccoides]|nr:neurogenic locus protein delta-like [Triticum dicoccoides]